MAGARGGRSLEVASGLGVGERGSKRPTLHLTMPLSQQAFRILT